MQNFKQWSVSDVKQSALGKVCKVWNYSAFPWQWATRTAHGKYDTIDAFSGYISYLPPFTYLIVYTSKISHYAIVEIKTIPLESEIIIDKLLRNTALI